MMDVSHIRVGSTIARVLGEGSKYYMTHAMFILTTPNLPPVPLYISLQEKRELLIPFCLEYWALVSWKPAWESN